MAVCLFPGMGPKARAGSVLSHTEPARAAFPSLPPQTHLYRLLTELGNKIRSPRDLRAEAEVTFGDELNGLVRRRKAVLWGFVFCFVFSCSLVPWNVLSTDNNLMQEHIGISSSVFSCHSPGALPLSMGTGRRNRCLFLFRKHKDLFRTCGGPLQACS